MSVLEIDLMPPLAREVGDTDTTNLYYSTDQLFSAINDGYKEFNKDMPQEYEVLLTGASAYFNPEPSLEDQRLIILYSARVLMRGELAKQSREAIIHSNPAGRTDLSNRPKYTREIIKDYDKLLVRLRLEKKEALVIKEMSDDGASMELRNSPTASPVEGLPITIIVTTK